MGPDTSDARTIIEGTDLQFLTHRETITADPIRGRDVIPQSAVDHGLLSLAHSAVEIPLRLFRHHGQSKIRQSGVGLGLLVSLGSLKRLMAH
jgi:hypothetical protein